MRKLEVDFEDVAMAMESHGEMEWCLDLETGKVFFVPDDTLTGEEDSDLIQRMEANPERYQEIPVLSSSEGHYDMESFTGTVKDPELQRRLGEALKGKGASRRFKDLLVELPEERERWFRFKSERMEQRIREWFVEDLQIEPIPKRRVP